MTWVFSTPLSKFYLYVSLVSYIPHSPLQATQRLFNCAMTLQICVAPLPNLPLNISLILQQNYLLTFTFLRNHFD